LGRWYEREKLLLELNQIDNEQRRYAVAIATAGDIPALASAMKEREQRRRTSKPLSWNPYKPWRSDTRIRRAEREPD